MPKSRYILDYYHLFKKVRERLSVVFEDKEELRKEKEALMKLLDSGKVDGALESIQVMSKRFRKRKKLEALTKLSGYIQRNREGIWYDEARDKGISIGSGTADKAGDILICRRMKLRGMRWSSKGANAVLSIRVLIANKEWDQFWAEHKAKLKVA